MPGFLDLANIIEVAGWAATEDQKRERIRIEINGEPIAEIECSILRPDLQQAQFGDARYGFHFIFPACVGMTQADIVSVIALSSGKPLIGSPRTVSFQKSESDKAILLRHAKTAAEQGNDTLARERFALLRSAFSDDVTSHLQEVKYLINRDDVATAKLVLREAQKAGTNVEGKVSTDVAQIAADLLVARARQHAPVEELTEYVDIMLRELDAPDDVSFLPAIVRTLKSSAVVTGLGRDSYVAAMTALRSTLDGSMQRPSETRTVALSRVAFGVLPATGASDLVWRSFLGSDLAAALQLFPTNNPAARNLLKERVLLELDNGTISSLTHNQLFGLGVLISTMGDEALNMAFYQFVDRHLAEVTPNQDTLVGTLKRMAALVSATAPNVMPLSELPNSISIIESNRLTIAFCVSGQLRGFRDAVQTWKRLNFQKHNVKTFVHVWKHVGKRFPDITNASRCFSGAFLDEYKRQLAFHGPGVLENRYSELFAWFTSANVADDIVKVFDPAKACVEDESQMEFALHGTAAKMYYKVEACYNLIRDFSSEFDLIIRFRPDREIESDFDDWQLIHEQCKSNRIIFADYAHAIHPWGTYAIGDQFAVGSPQLMSTYSQTHSFTKLAQAGKIYGFPEGYYHHLNFAYRTLLEGVYVRPAPIKFGRYFEAEQISPQLIHAHLLASVKNRTRDSLDDALINAIESDLKIAST